MLETKKFVSFCVAGVLRVIVFAPFQGNELFNVNTRMSQVNMLDPSACSSLDAPNKWGRLGTEIGQFPLRSSNMAPKVSRKFRKGSVNPFPGLKRGKRKMCAEAAFSHEGKGNAVALKERGIDFAFGLNWSDVEADETPPEPQQVAQGQARDST